MSELSAAPSAGRSSGRIGGGPASVRGPRAGTIPWLVAGPLERSWPPGCGGGRDAALLTLQTHRRASRRFWVDDQRHNLVFGGLMHRRGPGRPVRPPPHVRPRPDRIRPGLRDGGAVPGYRDAHRGAGGPGRRGGHARAADPDPDQRGLPGREAGGGHRDLGRHHRPGRGRRAGRGRCHRAGHLLAVDLLAQRSRRAGGRGAVRAAAARKPRSPAATGLHRHGPGRDRALRADLGAGPGALGRLGQQRGHRLVRGRWCSWPVSWPGNDGPGIRCCRWPTSAGASSPPPTR